MGKGYAVVDVATTGPAPGDRVIEVAVVHLDASGRRTDEWCTLVDPRRDFGPRHGISPADVRGAPQFAGVAGELAARLSGRVFAAQDLTFCQGFLTAEYARLGHAFAVSGLSTGPLEAPRGIALQDARASARLLVRSLDRIGTVEPVRLEVPRTVRAYAMQRSGGAR
ncbi:exonuclease domain-containing protein [Lentzea albida]|uniref:Exonuclease n=1 Tax=Lentzea albida TaxID=65499 RepID=A0A1H9U4N1_9PSEU|nr:exonuclease domain-containing protein [Lentzea albida]SES04520.1 Exonuclease [Lentzea albida]